MNERIRELYTQVVGDDKLNFDSYLAEKFAELLIRECAAKAWWAEQYNIGDGVPISKQIEQHFGVKE